MGVLGRIATTAAATGLAVTTGAGAAVAESDADGAACGCATAPRYSLIYIDNTERDSILEIDRTLNWNTGAGSAGSDNEGGD
ncbi:hypothetical protein [Goodfellowiella coeruleoviolacea]|uniref:Uncharacterized protein n=1 Tax=Goodfellowiella coeruleoviolacea TaxID=334858 RepID=A0AAE3KLG5_9PSEU|nr:hypothetical protein [Goodfellowiella coeruleoviolacea]MCP2166523.1 hypothetical protein [Goodfellowiella coeruleoviolacea]